ncbi:type VI secretion system lipoprotein TssJ [Massilia niastensis]|uniref:type VI secretion system lipoprotein TssJ n=1 Tax=Massilia niastensis TaxID=544911 RepID=UPI0003621236|nr:type VI secretion system lipoprotein TssJ [Massilia niastensis]
MSTIRVPAALALFALLAGCGGALDAIGLRKGAELADAYKPPRTVPVKLHAASRLNLDSRGQPLALAVRVYSLRHKAAFEQAPYAAFLDPQAERASLGADLVEVREVMLVPGQRYEIAEKVSREASHVGIVALFHRPAGGRWRAAFSVLDAERDGITLGLHACALTVGAATTLASVRCQ